MGRILVIAHREELIRQACEKIERVVGEAPDVEMGDLTADSGLMPSRVVVSSVQTQNSVQKCRQCRGVDAALNRCGYCGGRGFRYRMEKFDPFTFDLVIVDEAHHAPADSYRRLINHYQKNPACRVLGVTATPDRADEAALGQVFETVAYEYNLPDAIRDGWLVDIDQQYVAVEGLDISGVNTVAGDLNAKQLDEIMRQEGVLQGVCDATIRLAGDMPTLLFASSVQHAHLAADIFNRHRPESAKSLDGTTEADTRRDVIEAFSRGEFQYLCNCALFLEGFDEPRIGCVSIARPTKSRALYAQVVGRGTRPLPGIVDGLETPDQRRSAIRMSGKPSVLVLDFMGNSGRHKLISTADILAGNESDEVIERAAANAQNKSARGQSVNMLEEIDEAKEEIAAEKRKKVIATAKFSAHRISPFDVWDIVPQREPGWHKGRPITPKMKAMLDRAGIDTKDLSFVQAKQVIGKLIERRSEGKCSYKQAKLLIKNGYSPDVTFEEASRIIGELSKGWKSRSRT